MLGHGMEDGSSMYCRAQGARGSGAADAADDTTRM
jgi:hypothetical protein